MNRFYPVIIIGLLLATAASAQRNVTLQHYVSDANYVVLSSLPNRALLFSRFETTARASISNVTLGLVNQNAADDSVLFVIMANNGYGAMPYTTGLLRAPQKLIIPGGLNANINLNIQPPLVLDQPTVFYVGIVKLGQVLLKMDQVSQTPTCINAQGDTLITSGFGFLGTSGRYTSWGYKFTGGVLANNYYISVDLTYTDENPSTFFTDMTAVAKLDAYNPAQRMAWGDYDGDGWQDLLLGDKLYHNKKDGTFEDIGASIGFTKGSQVSMFVDVDNDGDLDIVCEPDNLVYLNNNGVFSLKSGTGLLPSYNTRAMAIADYDGDKFPDIFVANGEGVYVKNPSNPNDSTTALGAGFQCRLYKGNGDGSFVDKSTVAGTLGGYAKETKIGVNPYTGKTDVDGYRVLEGAEWSDFDNDGDYDLYVTTRYGKENYLFVNQGNLKFLNQASTKGIGGNFKTGSSFYGDAFGCEWADYNNDGMMDVLVGNASPAVLYPVYGFYPFDRTALYKNGGPPSFIFADQQLQIPSSGIAYSEHQGDVAWGDYNNDGLLDCFITSTAGCYKAQLFRQNPDGTFADVSYLSGTGVTGGWGATWVDYDNDGDLDLAVVSENGFMLFQNNVNNGNKWAEFNLKSISGNDYAIGARVTAVAGGRRVTREVAAGKGAGSQNPYTVHVGLEIYPLIDSLIIKWPTRKDPEILTNIAGNRIIDITETPAGNKPVISVSTTSVNFGSVYINQSKDQDIDVRNGGTAPLNLTAQELINNSQNQFSIVSAATSPIAPNSQSTIRVRFAPTSMGAKTAQLRIASNDAAKPEVLVDLNGTPLLDVKELPGVPATTQLFANFPNPFGYTSGASSTEMRFDLARDATVRMRLYNPLGMLVKELVNESYPAGSYRLLIDASVLGSLPSGAYTVMMEARTANTSPATFSRTISFVR